MKTPLKSGTKSESSGLYYQQKRKIAAANAKQQSGTAFKSTIDQSDFTSLKLTETCRSDFKCFWR